MFPVLESLSLGQLSFHYAISSLVGAFSFFRLKQLKLWNCPNIVNLLTHLANVQETFQLKSLEVTCGLGIESSSDREVQSVRTSFLQKFSGLRELYLSLPIMNWGEVAASVSNHVATLERVVLHARMWYTQWNNEQETFRMSEEDVEVNFCRDFRELFTRGHCKIVGMRISPALLVSLFHR